MIAAALYVTPSSVYKSMPGVDCFDQYRDARSYRGWLPVVAHPPCRSWGRLRHLANPRPDEQETGLHAVMQVRRCTGVLEHPSGSLLWVAAGLPRPGTGVDAWGGFSVSVDQSDYGHPARKSTWLYIVSESAPGEVCKALRAGEICKAAAPGELRKVKNQPSARRMDTPPEFASLLLSLVTLTP